MALIMRTIWPMYVIVSSGGREKTEGYPLQVYADKALAEEVARANGDFVIKVAELDEARIAIDAEAKQ